MSFPSRSARNEPDALRRRAGQRDRTLRWDRNGFRERTGGRLNVSALSFRAIILPMQSFTVTIEGEGWADVQNLELPRLPREGELIETKYGTCRVTHSESVVKTEGVDGKIVCKTS